MELPPPLPCGTRAAAGTAAGLQTESKGAAPHPRAVGALPGRAMEGRVLHRSVWVGRDLFKDHLSSRPTHLRALLRSRSSSAPQERATHFLAAFTAFFFYLNQLEEGWSPRFCRGVTLPAPATQSFAEGQTERHHLSGPARYAGKRQKSSIGVPER